MINMPMLITSMPLALQIVFSQNKEFQNQLLIFSNLCKKKIFTYMQTWIWDITKV